MENVLPCHVQIILCRKKERSMSDEEQKKNLSAMQKGQKSMV